MRQPTDSNLVFRALIVLGLVLFGAFLLAERGLVTLALDADKSRISYVILGLYALASLHWLILAGSLSRERARFARLEADPDAERTALKDGAIGRFLSNLELRQREQRDGDCSTLVSAFGDELFNRHAFGHFASDVLLKLGLLGTVVGFIFMLLPVAELAEFEASLMQDLLKSMSSGMAVALYTTLAGLITSTLLKLQYHLLDASVADLATRLAVLADVRLNADAA